MSEDIVQSGIILG